MALPEMLIRLVAPILRVGRFFRRLNMAYAA